MAACNSIFRSSSVSNEQRWVYQITETLDQKEDTIIHIDVCIFQLPKTLTSINPEAYAPCLIGLGPYHHLRQDLHKMERRKLAAAKRVLRDSRIDDPQKVLINKIKESELVIRGFYDQYIDLDGDTIAWIFAIDGLFLFDHLNTYDKRRGSVVASEARRKEAQDILMLENQIPLFLLFKLIRKFIQLEADHIADRLSVMLPYFFLESHSPLELNQEFSFQHGTNHVHLLDYMYHLIVNNRGVILKMSGHGGMSRISEVEITDGIKKISDAAVNVGSALGVPQQYTMPFQVIQNLPWKYILSLFKKSDESESSPLVEEIVIPSATQLSSIAKINFSKTIGGIRDIKFEEEKRTMYLPVIKLNVDSEVILRNLIVYEASMGKNSLELAEYVDLMCGIVDTAEDVQLLVGSEIIHKDGLSNEEIAKLFNGIRKSSTSGKLKEIIDKVNKEYENKPRVKVSRSLKKYGYTTWKVLTSMAAVVLVLLFVLQAICQVYGCSTRFFGYKNDVSSLSFFAES